MSGQALFTHPVDRAVFRQCPVDLASTRQPLRELPVGGVRYVLASNGTFLECRTAALRFRGCIGGPTGLPLGCVDPLFELSAGPLPADLLDSMAARAGVCCPDEWAGAVYLEDGYYTLREPEVLSRGQGHIRFLASETTGLVLDAHSHGRSGAWFSATDDADDAASPASVFVSMVLGRCDRRSPDIVARVVCQGWAFHLDLQAVCACGGAGMGMRLLPAAMPSN